MESKSIFFLVFLANLLVVALVSGNECRTSKTVAESAQSVDDNSAAGGHIWQHIRGLKSRPKGAEKSETQDGKTLFASERDYQGAWQRFQSGIFKYLTPYQCKGKPKGQAVDCVLAADIEVNTAYKCTAVDKKTKLCIEDDEADVTFVEFWYAQKNGKWVLNTAYPSGANTPTHACQKIPTAKAQENKGNYILKMLIEKLLQQQ